MQKWLPLVLLVGVCACRPNPAKDLANKLVRHEQSIGAAVKSFSQKVNTPGTPRVQLELQRQELEKLIRLTINEAEALPNVNGSDSFKAAAIALFSKCHDVVATTYKAVTTAPTLDSAKQAAIWVEKTGPALRDLSDKVKRLHKEYADANGF
jgi:hypothetical protein